MPQTVEVTLADNVIITASVVSRPVHAYPITGIAEATRQAGLAADSASAAASSEAAAATSETNAANSANAAATSENNAAASETAAAASEVAAMASEVAAGDSEAAAATSETNAANSASAAATSETNAATSETNAANSASAAADSEANAATSETNAANSASAAATSESNAAASETAAGASETAAGNSASAAATSETNAANSASAASASEANAATSETNAANSAGAAATSAANTQAYYEDFVGRYYGGLAADPTLDPNGYPPGAGDLYFNTVSGVLRAYSELAGDWQDATNNVDIAVDTFNGDGSTVSFVMSFPPPTVGAALVMVGGVIQRPGIDFTVSGTTLTFSEPPPFGTNNILVLHIGRAGEIGVPADDVSFNRPNIWIPKAATFSTTGTNTAYTANPGLLTLNHTETIPVYFHAPNGVNPTLNIDGRGDWPIYHRNGFQVLDGALQGRHEVMAFDDGGAWRWVVLDPLDRSIDMTGYTGSDIELVAGDTAFYTVSGDTALNLRIGVASGAVYEIIALGGAPGMTGHSELRVNNAAYVGEFRRYGHRWNEAPSSAPITSTDVAGLPFSYGDSRHVKMAVIFNAAQDHVESDSKILGHDGSFMTGIYMTGISKSAFNQVITSLGQLTWGAAFTGDVTVRRIR